MIGENVVLQYVNAKISGIVNMAFDFSTMARIYEPGSKKLLIKRFQELFEAVEGVDKAADFNALHEGFCEWGI